MSSIIRHYNKSILNTLYICLCMNASLEGIFLSVKTYISIIPVYRIHFPFSIGVIVREENKYNSTNITSLTFAGIRSKGLKGSLAQSLLQASSLLPV